MLKYLKDRVRVVVFIKMLNDVVIYIGFDKASLARRRISIFVYEGTELLVYTISTDTLKKVVPRKCSI